MNSQNYKLYQMLSFFVMKFSYKTLQAPEMKKDELWLINPTHQYYPIIRLTTNSIEQVIFEENRLNETVTFIKKRLRISGRLLDIHLCKDEILSDEAFDSAAFDTNYHSGLDLNDIYPGIRNVIHEVNDPSLEISEIIKEINVYSQKAKIQRKNIREKKPYVTYSVIIICVILQLFTYFLSGTYNEIDVLILLGANYETFTVGLWQFFRLLTSGLLHGGIIHLAMNMLSLYYMGPYLEKEIGSAKFALVLFGSVITGSLMSLLLNGNTVSVGLSGGLYGLMMIYIIQSFKNNTLKDSGTIQVIVINVLINFVGGVDAYAHLGGTIAGAFFYYALFENKLSYLFLLLVISILAFKVYTVETIAPKYSGTDMSVVRIYRDWGLNAYADNLEDRLYNVYENR